jgi:hypothetical protein
MELQIAILAPLVGIAVKVFHQPTIFIAISFLPYGLIIFHFYFLKIFLAMIYMEVARQNPIRQDTNNNMATIKIKIQAASTNLPI